MSLKKIKFPPLLSGSHSALQADTLQSWEGTAWRGCATLTGAAEQAWSYAEGGIFECSLTERKEDKSHGKPWWEMVCNGIQLI